MAATRTYIKNKAVSRLEELGLTAQLLRDTVLVGEVARNNASILHPMMFPGYLAYAERVKKLRELLLPKGWKPVTERGLEMIVSPDGLTSILTSVGDEGTGDATKELKTKNRKGQHTAKIVEINNQLSLFDEIVSEDDFQMDNRSCWYLMVRVTLSDIKYELVRPIKIDDENKLCGFSERIIFEPISMENLNSPQLKSKTSESNDDDEDIIVEVSKR